MLIHAYQAAFTEANIVTAFRKSGIWPVDSKQLLSVPRPVSREQIGTILNVEDLERMFEEKRVAMRRQVVGAECVLLGNGYIDTTRCAVLTSDKALSLIREKETRDKAVKQAADIEAARKAAKRAHIDSKNIAFFWTPFLPETKI